MNKKKSILYAICVNNSDKVILDNINSNNHFLVILKKIPAKNNLSCPIACGSVTKFFFNIFFKVQTHLFSRFLVNWVEGFSTFWRFFKMETLLPIRYIFRISIPHPQQGFHFHENHRDLKYIHFNSKNIHPK